MKFPSSVPLRGLRALAGLAAFSVFACFPFDSGEDSKFLTYVSLSARTWVLASYSQNGSADSIPDSTLHVMFNDSGAVSMVGCNATGGAYTLVKDTLRFGPMVRTTKACLSSTLRRGTTGRTRCFQGLCSHRSAEEA